MVSDENGVRRSGPSWFARSMNRLLAVAGYEVVADTGHNDPERGLIAPGGQTLQTYGVAPMQVSMPQENTILAPTPAVPRQPASEFTFGAVGTPVWGGFVRDLGEYNAQFDGRRAFQVYEQMRRSDADVQALLFACKLPIKAAQWEIVPGAKQSDPHYARAKEIANFVRENLFGGLERALPTGNRVTQTFESVIDNALLMFDFGCSAHEDLWRIDNEYVRLERMAPRLPLTFYRFWVDEDGESLLALEQWGYRKDAWVNVVVPAEKIAYFTMMQEGANYYGRSMLRAVYPHWWIKSQLYRTQAIAAERNAMGVPIIIKGQSAQYEQDSAKATQFVSQLAAHENMGLALPPGWQFKLMGVEGKTYDLQSIIQHQSEMILRAGLAGFLALGTGKTGSFALSSSEMDFFLLSEKAQARHIGEVLTHQTIRRLVDYNFEVDSPSLYPRLVSSNIVVLNPLEMLKALQVVADFKVDLVQPSEETEAYIRTELGLPKKEATRQRWAPTAVRITERETGVADPEETADVGTAEPIQANATSPPIAEALSQRGKTDWAPHEKSVEWKKNRKMADSLSLRVATVLKRQLPKWMRQAAQQTEGVTAAQLAAITIPVDYAAAQRLTPFLRAAREYGREAIYKERETQTGRKRSDGIKQLVNLSADIRHAPKQNTDFVAEATVGKVQNWVTARAGGAAADLLGSGAVGQDLVDRVYDELAASAHGFIDRDALEAVLTAMGAGRLQALGELTQEIESYSRSEVDDNSTCEVCAAHDGDEWKTLDQVDWSPGDDCLGGQACRGALVAIFAVPSVVAK